MISCSGWQKLRAYARSYGIAKASCARGTDAKVFEITAMDLGLVGFSEGKGRQE